MAYPPVATIPDAVLDAYAARFPHLRALADNARKGDLRAVRTFAQTASRIVPPASVSVSELAALVALAEPTR
jgi:hypothetical protein